MSIVTKETIAVTAIDPEIVNWQPSGRLRWARYQTKTHNLLVLEQHWVDRNSGKSEWREVPTEDIP